MYTSNCCDSPPIGISYEIEMCPVCKEHCTYEEIPEDDDEGLDNG